MMSELNHGISESEILKENSKMQRMKKHLFFIWLAMYIVMLGPVQAYAQNISTIAGNGILAFSGDGGPATFSEIYYPCGVAVDNGGNVFLADNGNNRIRKINSAGIITTIAGGTAGYSGDGGQATAAELFSPSGVATDNSGNVYFADSYNSCIRKINTSGIISTIAGNGTAGYSGDGGAATNASLNSPFGLIADNSGNIYIPDYGNSVVRKINASGIISTIAGNGIAGFSGDGGAATFAKLFLPFGVAVDNSGNLFVSDYGNSRIRKINPSGIISTIAGNGTFTFSGDDGPATNAGIGSAFGITVDASGNVYIADRVNQRIRKVNVSGIISTVAGNGTAGFTGDSGDATAAELSGPNDMAIDNSGNMFISDNGNSRIRKVSSVYNQVTKVSNISKYIKVYPNPTSGNFAVAMSGTGTQISVSLMDIAGKIITTQTENNFLDPKIAFNIQAFAAGDYLVRVTIDGEVYTEKIVLTAKQ